MSYRYEITGDRRVSEKFDQFPEQARGGLEKRIRGLTSELKARIETAVHRHTGKLAGEIQSYIFSDEKGVAGKVIVGTRDREEIIRALSLEYGAHGSHGQPVHVRSYARAGGSSLASRLLGHGGIVDAYTRKVNIQEQDYLRGPLHAMEGTILEQLREALNEAVVA